MHFSQLVILFTKQTKNVNHAYLFHSSTMPVFCRFVLPCQILLPSIKTVGSTIWQLNILPFKLGFINVYTYHNLKPTLTVMHIL